MIKGIIKFVIAFVIIYWLFQRGQIDFSLIPKSLEYKGIWAICFSILFINVIVTSLRWRFLLKIKSTAEIKIIDTIKLTWIGMFFSTVLPGAVTGDIIKLVYARDLDRTQSKSFFLTTIFLDRLIGLLGLLTILGIFTLIYYQEISVKSEQLAHLVNFNFLIFFGVLMAVATIFTPKKMQNILSGLAAKIPFIGHKFVHLFEQIWFIGTAPKTVFLCICMSLIGQSCNVFAFITLAYPFLSAPIDMGHAFTFIPLGMVGTAIPITPAGLGVGHALYSALFGFFGINNGASLFNLFFLANVGINLIGAIPYTLFTKKIS